MINRTWENVVEEVEIALAKRGNVDVLLTYDQWQEILKAHEGRLDYSKPVHVRDDGDHRPKYMAIIC